MWFHFISKLKNFVLSFVGIFAVASSQIVAGDFALDTFEKGRVVAKNVKEESECAKKLSVKKLSHAVCKMRDNFVAEHDNFKDKATILVPYALTNLALLGNSSRALSTPAMLGCATSAWLLSDLGTGFVHLTFDVLDYTNKKLPRKLRNAAKIFQYHHEFPGHCVKESFGYHTRAFYLNFGVPLLAASSVFAVYDYNALSCLLSVAAILAPLGDYVHALSHGKDNNILVRFLQKTGIIISREQHRFHHTHPDHATNYCIWNGHMNIVFNPIVSVSRSVYDFFSEWW